MRSRKKYDAVATVRKYKDKETGEERKQYCTVDTVFESEDGRLSLKLDVVPIGPGWSGYIQFFEPRAREPYTPSPQSRTLRGMPAAAPVDQGSRDDDDIPF